jgi:hypothetical protein
MEVISKLDSDNWSAECTCTNCDSRLKINRHDLHSELIKAYSYEEEDYNIYHVHCPVCKKTSRVPLNIIPKLIQIEN